MKKYKTIEDGKETGEFNAENLEHAQTKVLGWHGIVVEEV